MIDDTNDDESPRTVILSCGHLDDGQETLSQMMVILKDEMINRATGAITRAFSTGCWCANCRARPDIASRRLADMVAVERWLMGE